MSERKKYEFTGEMKPFLTHLVRRIRSLEDIWVYGSTLVPAGSIGGWIETEENLSQEGEAWVFDDAIVCGNAMVFGNAAVAENATVFGNVRISGEAIVCGNATVRGDAEIFDVAIVDGDAHIVGKAKVFGEAQVGGKSFIGGRVWVYGAVEILNDEITGNERLFK